MQIPFLSRQRNTRTTGVTRASIVSDVSSIVSIDSLDSDFSDDESYCYNKPNNYRYLTQGPGSSAYINIDSDAIGYEDSDSDADDLLESSKTTSTKKKKLKKSKKNTVNADLTDDNTQSNKILGYTPFRWLLLLGIAMVILISGWLFISYGIQIARDASDSSRNDSETDANDGDGGDKKKKKPKLKSSSNKKPKSKSKKNSSKKETSRKSNKKSNSDSKKGDSKNAVVPSISKQDEKNDIKSEQTLTEERQQEGPNSNNQGNSLEASQDKPKPLLLSKPRPVAPKPAGGC